MKRFYFSFILALFFSLSISAQNPACAKTDESTKLVKAGTPMRFVATLSGKTEKLNLEYEWTVSAGTIVRGQGTCSIVVDTTGLEGQNVTAEVKVKGLPESCPNTASETRSVAAKIIGDALDQFGRLPDDEIKARIDALYVSLGNEPDAQGYIIIYGTAAEIAARERQIRRAIAFRKFDAKRVTIVNGGPSSTGGVWTVVWIVPPGADKPQS